MDLDSTTMTVTAPVSSLEASLTLVVLQGGRESTGAGLPDGLFLNQRSNFG
jgi:hypothetical protein